MHVSVFSLTLNNTQQLSYRKSYYFILRLTVLYKIMFNDEIIINLKKLFSEESLAGKIVELF